MAISTIGTASISGLGYGFKNRIINGGMQVSQRATSATVTAGTGVPTASTGYPCVDRFFVYSTGANVTAAQSTGSGANKNNLQITGAASVTAVGIGQRIEQLNSYDLAGSTATLSCYISNSLLTTVTWTASYATTADTFGTIGTPTKTQIATGTFTVSATRTQYTTNITIPAAATTGIEILFTVGAQISGTWVIDSVQLEAGTVATSFDWRPYGTELALCQRYYVKSYETGTAPGSATTAGLVTVGVYASTIFTYQFSVQFPVVMRVAPTAVSYWDGNGNASRNSTLGNGTTTWTHNVNVSGTPFNFASTGFTFNYGTSTNGVYFIQYATSAEL